MEVGYLKTDSCIGFGIAMVLLGLEAIPAGGPDRRSGKMCIAHFNPDSGVEVTVKRFTVNLPQALFDDQTVLNQMRKIAETSLLATFHKMNPRAAADGIPVPDLSLRETDLKTFLLQFLDTASFPSYEFIRENPYLTELLKSLPASSEFRKWGISEILVGAE